LQGDTEFRKIVAHFWKDGILFLKAQYIDTIQGSQFINTPFAKLRRDEPVPCAKYVREYVAEFRRGNRPLNDWALKLIRQHSNIIRRMQIDERIRKYEITTPQHSTKIVPKPLSIPKEKQGKVWLENPEYNGRSIHI